MTLQHKLHSGLIIKIAIREFDNLSKLEIINKQIYMFQPIGSFIVDLIALVGFVFIIALLIITPVKKPSYIKWKWISIGLAVLGLLLKLMDELI